MGHERNDALRLLQGALRLSHTFLSEDRSQLLGQLMGHLLPIEYPPLQHMVDTAISSTADIWLRPMSRTGQRPGGALQRTIVTHAGSIKAVCVVLNGRYVLATAGKKINGMGLDDWRVDKNV